MPKFSIILPLRNCGNYLDECVQSILAQNYEDFELLILAHDSDAETLTYLNSINDERAKIIYAENIDGIVGNWARIKDVPKSEFMTIIGYDDVLKPNFINEINRLIEKYPDASLYHTHFDFIDEGGKTIRASKPMKEIQTASEVITNYVGFNADLMATGFVMRSDNYNKVGGMPLYPSLLFADMELIIRLSQQGYLAVSDKICFQYRVHSKSTTKSSGLINYVKGFEKLLKYLANLKKEKIYEESIELASFNLLNKCGEFITKRTLLAKNSIEDVYSVNDIIILLNKYGNILCQKNSFNALENKKIKMAKRIENNSLLRTFFQLIKNKTSIFK